MLLQPVILPELGLQVQVNNVPGTCEVNMRFVGILLQRVSESGILERSGNGKTITLKSVVAPRQPYA